MDPKMARFAPLVLVVCCALGAPVATASPRGSWDLSQQRAVAAAGLMPAQPDGRFGGEQPLTGTQLNGMLAGLGLQLDVPGVMTSAPFVTVAHFDRLVVRHLGLAHGARAVQEEAARAGLAPPPHFGTEVVARLRGLRFNHPSPQGEALELSPWEHITRAEAAWSAAVVLGFGGWEVGYARDQLAGFVLPAYTPAERAVLRTAVSKIGMPYIWGGETDGPSYGQVHGGYDCSGLVYRAYATRGLPRLTAAMYAGAVPKRARLRVDQLRPADLMFFGDGKFWSHASERTITHTALVLGNGWVIQSSSQGVAIVAMVDRVYNFAWGRRIL